MERVVICCVPPMSINLNDKAFLFMSTQESSAVKDGRLKDASLVARLLDRSIVCDMTLPIGTPGSEESQRRLFKRLLKSGFSFVSITVATDDEDPRQALDQIARYRAMCAEEGCVLIQRVADIERAKAAGVLAIALNFQGTVPVGRNLELISVYYSLGVKHMLMAYNQRNFVADGCHELTDAGLSRFGRSLIAEMNRVGMIVDVAHTSYRSSLDAIECSTHPVIVSHGNVWALNQHPRCCKDEQIRAIANKNGVVGLTGLNIFTGDDSACAEGYVRQIDYIVQLVGPAHVGFGFDYVHDLPTLARSAQAQAAKWPPEGGYSRSDIAQVELESLPLIVQRMLDLGYSEEAIRGILGANWLRVMRAVEADQAIN